MLYCKQLPCGEILILAYCKISRFREYSHQMIYALRQANSKLLIVLQHLTHLCVFPFWNIELKSIYNS